MLNSLKLQLLYVLNIRKLTFVLDYKVKLHYTYLTEVVIRNYNYNNIIVLLRKLCNVVLHVSLYHTCI